MKILDTAGNKEHNLAPLITASEKYFKDFRDNTDFPVVLVDLIDHRLFCKVDLTGYSSSHYLDVNTLRPIDVLGKEVYSELLLRGFSLHSLVFLVKEIRETEESEQCNYLTMR